MNPEKYERIRQRAQKEYPHSGAARALHGAVLAMLVFALVRVEVDKKLHEASHDAGGPELEAALEGAMIAAANVRQLLHRAVSIDSTACSAETRMVRSAVQWLDNDSILREAGCLLDHADELEKAAAGDGEITAEIPAISQRQHLAEMAVTAG